VLKYCWMHVGMVAFQVNELLFVDERGIVVLVIVQSNIYYHVTLCKPPSKSLKLGTHRVRVKF
jgi:hypothetical protein